MILTAIVLLSLGRTPDQDRVLRAIEQVESGGNCRAIGDGGRSIGPCQIQFRYWKDARMPGRYSNCWSRAYSYQTIENYMRRYCPAAWSRADVTVIARTHNGGPAGCSVRATLPYAAKVKRAMRP